MADPLFRHLLESTLWCMLLGSLTYCLRRQAAAVRHSVWLISTLKFLIPTVVLTATGARLAFILPASDWISSLAGKVLAVLVNLVGMLPIHINAGNATVVSLAFLIIWALGSVAMFGIWFTRLRKSYDGLSVAQNGEHAALDRAKQRFHVRATVGLGSSEEQKEPALVGMFRPVIAVPQGLSEQLTTAELEAVLTHELAHARRRDNLASAFVHCLVCIFWFHPLLWFVEKQLIAERERACDEMVIDSGVVPGTYVAGLIKVCKFHLFGEVAGVSAVNGSDLRTRLDQILSYHASKPIPYVVRLVVACFALFTTILPIAGGYCEQCVSNGQKMTSTGLKNKPRTVQSSSSYRNRTN